MSLALYLSVLLLGFLLWLRGLVIVNERKQIVRYAIINAIILLVYTLLWLNYSQLVTGHDEYGLGALFGYPIILVIHSLVVFVILLVTFRK